MTNLVPKSEGYITPAQFEQVVKELRDVIVPLLDGLDLSDALPIATEAIGAVSVIKAIPAEHRVMVGAMALAQIAAEVTADLVVIYPEEIQ